MGTQLPEESWQRLVAAVAHEEKALETPEDGLGIANGKKKNTVI